MEEEDGMENGYETDYPDPVPAADSPTPYPALSKDNASPRPGTANGISRPSTANGSSRPGTANGDHHSYSLETLTPWRGSAPTYTTLAEYFNIGNIGRYQLEAADDPAPENDSDNDEGDGDGEGEAEGDGNLSRSRSRSGSVNDHYGSPQPVEPVDNSLPGFHALPDIDFRYPMPSRAPLETDSIPQTEPSTPHPRGRGAGRPRKSATGTRGKRGRGSWKKAIEKTDHAELFKKPRLPRDPTAGRRGRKKGPSIPKRVDPGEDYKRSAALANQAYFSGDLDQALEHIFEAIRANPEVYHGHVLFSEILEKQGRLRDALYAITNGAAVKRDPQVWLQVAERYLAIEPDEQHPDDVLSAIKCYSEASRLDKDNCEIREGKLSLLLEIEDWIGAKMECKALCRLRPSEIDYVRQYTTLCNMSGKSDDRLRAIHAYETAFRLLSQQPSAEKLDERWDHLNVYLDLLYKANQAPHGIAQSKRLARWFLGRKQDTFWDNWDIDDREFDIDDSRRKHVWQYEQWQVIRDPLKYGKGLPLDIRVKMGLFRAQMGHIYQPEARTHLDHLLKLADQAENFADMFADAGHCMKNCGFAEVAITFFEPLKQHADLVDEEKFWMDLGQCYQRVGRNEDAEECFLNVIEISEGNIDAHMALVKLYHATDQKVKAHSMANEVTRLGHKQLLLRERLRFPKPPRPPKKIAPKKSTPKKRDSTAVEEPNTNEINEVSTPKKRKTKPTKKVQENAVQENELAQSDAETPTETDVNGGANGVRIAPRPEADKQDQEHEQDTDFHIETVDPTPKGAPSKRYKNQARWLKAHNVRVCDHYAKVKELWTAFEAREDEDAVQQWMQHANGMAKDFRAVKEFFPLRERERYFTGLKTGKKNDQRRTLVEMAALKNRMQNSALTQADAEAMRALDTETPKDFHGIAFAEWHRILSTLALAYAERVDQENCHDLLQHVLLKCNVFFHNQELKNTTLALCICCALLFNDSKFAAETALQYDFPGLHKTAKTTHLLAASGRLVHGDGYLGHKQTAQWAERTVKEHDYLAMTPEERMKVNWGEEEGRLNKLAEQNNSITHELDPGLLTTFAHILANRQNNTHLTLSYLFRALAVQPENVVTNLSVAVTYFNASIKTTGPGKQHLIVQGQAFLYRYYDLRTASGKASYRQEAEFNRGRAWQMVDFTLLAMDAYERVLNLSEKVQEEGRAERKEADEVEDFAKEAAFALRGLFVKAGNLDAAREVSEKWLML